LKVKIVAVSDLHGTLPTIPSCDLLLLAGDLTPVTNHDVSFQAQWLATEFRRWLEGQPARKIIGIAGNHDFLFEQRPDLVPQDLPWTYLQDTLIDWEGLTIYGSPWQPWFFDWAFNLQEAELKEKWDLIPAGVDILVLHGPPYGYGDGVPSSRAPGGVRRCGCLHLLSRIQVLQPRLAVYGHIHEGRGEWRLGDTVLANVTLLDAAYNAVYQPWLHEFER
jgi:Icc-related predicted phosphoesterase